MAKRKKVDWLGILVWMLLLTMCGMAWYLFYLAIWGN